MTTSFNVDTDLKDLILRTLGTEYMSISCTDGVPTGNHYQSVALGDFKTRGFREDRAPLLDLIDFQGKKVLDLGSNLGELSRAARERGAYLVDGFEVDPYFLEIAELVNVFTGATRVSFYQRDIADAASYEERYDIVLAFAVFHYIHRCLSRIAERTDVLVLETHKLEGNFESGYMQPVSKYFPHHQLLGESDWGSTFDSREVRAVVVFAKDQASLLGALQPGAAARQHQDTSTKPSAQPPAQISTRLIDPAGTTLQDRFFTNFSFDSSDELLTAVDSIDVDVSALAKSQDSRRSRYRGWIYWFLYLKGYCQYRRSGEIGPGNIYFDYLMDHFDDPDTSMSRERKDTTAAIEHVKRRFQDMDLFSQRDRVQEASELVAPIRVFAGNRSSETALRISESGSGNQQFARAVDGWHRVFAARVFGVSSLRCEVVDEQSSAPIRGAIEHLSVESGRLRMRGWCLHPERRADTVVITSGEGREVAVAGITRRTDVAAAFPHIPHADRSGFEVDADYEPEARDKPFLLRLTTLRNWFAVGEMSIECVAGASDGRRWPAGSLAERHFGTTDPEMMALRSFRALHQMLEPLNRYRTISSFESVLDFGCGCGGLEVFMQDFLSGASVTGIEFDDEAIEWCREIHSSGLFLAARPDPPTDLSPDSFDLVIGHRILTRLGREAQNAWLAEVSRLMGSGAYAALTVKGELVKPFISDRAVLDGLEAEGISRTVAHDDQTGRANDSTYQTREYSVLEYGRRFDVVTYVEGGVGNEFDLIVLRKP